LARTNPADATWRTSGYSNIGGNCVEVTAAGGIVGVRDSKDRGGAVLAFSPAAWLRFATWAKSAAEG
jgi:hypothetical protein